MNKIVSGRYRVLSVIGTGGMAIVYRAWDEETKQEVALKMLRPEYQADSEFIRRFDHEAIAASKMSHENIVKMHGVGTDGETRYIVMEYVDGQTLKEIIQRERRIAPAMAVRYALKILAALDHAHKSGIIHRDIKPQNILVDHNGVIKVADFGIARLMNAETGTITDSKTALGSAHYASPEQVGGNKVDEKSDLYSLGIVIYEMLTGTVPFDGESTVAVALKQIKDKPRSMRSIHRDISRGLDEVIMKALEKDPARRYQSAMEMAVDLKRALRMPGGGFVDDGSRPAFESDDRESAMRTFLRTRGLNTLLAVLACVTVLVIVSVGVVKISDILYGVDIPGVVGHNRLTAEQVLQNYELEPIVIEVYEDTVSEGEVFRQEPEQGTRGRRDDSVTIYVSLGPQPIALPDTVGMTLSEARSVLSLSGFTRLNEDYVVVADQAVDVIVDQQPNNGMAQTGSIVTLKVNSLEIPTPQLIGKSLAEVEKELTAVGLKLGEVSTGYALDEAPDTVIVQNPSVGTLLVKGSRVNVTVSLANPAVYYARYSVYSPLKMNVRVILEMPSGQKKEIMNEMMDAETHRNLEMQSNEAGMHRVYVYFDDQLNTMESVEFQ